MKYLVQLHVRALGHIEPLDSRTPTPGDAHTLKKSTAPRVVLGSLQVPRHVRRGETKGAHPQLFPVGSHQLLLCESDVFTAPFSPQYLQMLLKHINETDGS